MLRGAAVLLLVGCARATEVELRLYPCGLHGGVPVRVDLEVRGFDAADAPLAPLRATFQIPPGPGVLGDGYATVGLAPPDGLVRADFIVTWHDAEGEAEVVVHPNLAVPGLGEVLELGAEMCAPVDASSGGSSTGGSSSSSGESSSSSGSESSSTGDGTTTTGDGTTTTGDGTTTTTGDTTDDTSGTSTTGEETMVGSFCDSKMTEYYCEGGGPGQLGTLLECIDAKWAKADLVKRCNLDAFCTDIGLIEPKAVGCSGIGPEVFSCVCQDAVPQPCIGDEAACQMGQEIITLCIENELDTPIRTKGRCAVVCYEDGDGPMCKPG